MSLPNSRYIDSHWLLFAAKGALAVIFGWILLFNSGTDYVSAIALCGVFLLAFSVIEFINSLHRAHLRFGWLITVALALLDTIAAFLLILNTSDIIITSSLTLGAYTLIRGFAEILIGIRIDDDTTDRFIWILTGIVGAVMGIVIVNCGALEDTTLFIRFFGSFIMTSGVTNLIYGIHNRSQKAEYLAAKAELLKSRAKKSRKTTQKKSQKSPKKSK